MASGSLPAIYKMIEIIEWQRDSGIEFNLTPEQIRKQFEIEYGISITPAAIAAAEELAPPTVRELVEEQGYIEQREASVRLRLENDGRDYL